MPWRAFTASADAASLAAEELSLRQARLCSHLAHTVVELARRFLGGRGIARATDGSVLLDSQERARRCLIQSHSSPLALSPTV